MVRCRRCSRCRRRGSACLRLLWSAIVPSATRSSACHQRSSCVAATLKLPSGSLRAKQVPGVGSGVVLCPHTREGGRQIAGVVRFIDLSVDSQEVNIFAVHPCNGQIVEMLVRRCRCQSAYRCMPQASSCSYAADAGNIQSAARRDAVENAAPRRRRCRAEVNTFSVLPSSRVSWPASGCCPPPVRPWRRYVSVAMLAVKCAVGIQQSAHRRCRYCRPALTLAAISAVGDAGIAE